MGFLIVLGLIIVAIIVTEIRGEWDNYDGMSDSDCGIGQDEFD